MSISFWRMTCVTRTDYFYHMKLYIAVVLNRCDFHCNNLILRLKRWSKLFFYSLNSFLFQQFFTIRESLLTQCESRCPSFKRALLVQPLWYSSFMSCFTHRFWKWIETKRHYLHNECVKGCVFMCFPSHSSCFVKLPPVRWLTCSMRWNLASVDLTICW